jgi:imidazolonepropionase-like amidohydrolase
MAAVRAGVHTIEHGTWLSDETLRLMKEKGVYLSPTLTATHDLADAGGDYDNSLLQMRGRMMLPRANDMVQRAWKMGVKIIASTDTGYLAKSNERITDEMINLAELGLSPMDAIKAGTSVAAEALGVSNRTGSIRVGYEADLVVIDRNPLDNIHNVQDLIVVINNGRVAFNEFNVAPR